MIKKLLLVITMVLICTMFVACKSKEEKETENIAQAVSDMQNDITNKSIFETGTDGAKFYWKATDLREDVLQIVLNIEAVGGRGNYMGDPMVNMADALTIYKADYEAALSYMPDVNEQLDNMGNTKAKIYANNYMDACGLIYNAIESGELNENSTDISDDLWNNGCEKVGDMIGELLQMINKSMQQQ